MPLGYAVVYGSARRALLRRFPFSIFYTVDERGVLVVGVLHSSRHPRFWMRRV
jgi:hypothetical protein